MENEASSAESQMSKDEQVGYHKGSLTVLAKEREELLKMVSIVEQLMQMHVKALKDLGIDLAAQAKAAANTTQQPQTKEKLDSLLNK